MKRRVTKQAITCSQGHVVAQVGRYKGGQCKACFRDYMKNYMRQRRQRAREENHAQQIQGSD